MIKLDELKTHISPHDVQKILTHHTQTGGVFIDIEECCSIYCDATFYLTTKMQPELYKLAGTPIEYTKRNVMPNILINRFGIPTSLLQRNKKLSTDKRVLNPLLSNPNISDDAKRFIQYYQACTKLLRLRSSLEKFMEAPLSKVLSVDGHRMSLIRTTWHVLSTSRLATSSPSLQNIAKVLANIITYPENMILLYADSGQIEPRITYSHYIRDELIKHLICAYNDAYYGLLHYCMLSDEDLQKAMDNVSSVKPHEITDDMIANRDMLKKLTLSANYGSKMRYEDNDLAKLYMKRIVNHPKRLQLIASITNYVENGGDRFKSAFGTIIIPEETDKYKKTDNSWKDHLIRCGINNPIQTTASDLMCESVYTANKILKESAHQYSKIAYYKHDEAVFYLMEQDRNLMKDLQEVTAYQVKDWIPIYSDVHVGRKKGKTIEEIVNDMDLD